MATHPVDVVCAIIANEGLVLACQRPSGKHLAGLWEFPGGKVEPDESKESALLREIHEELHIHLTILAALTPVEWRDHHTHIILHPYHCQLSTGLPHPAEHAQIRWCSPSELAALDWAEADIPICREWLALHANRNHPPC
jgi:8-oxo-dGTP diphosphatase